MDALALTDRDGLYGAVKFARAARSAGIRPVLGVDLALERDRAALAGAGMGRPPALRSPAPAGPARRAAAPPSTRGTRGSPCWPGTSAGWAALCRLVVGHPPARRAREAGEHPGPGRRARPGRGRAGGGLLVLLGPGSEVGRALTARRPDLARAVLARWREVVEPSRPGARGGLAPRSRRPAPGRPDARAGRRGAAHRGAHQRGALRRPLRRPDRRRARRVPPAGRRSTPATSTGSTPRATSSPARRWRRSPRRSPRPRGWTATAARRLLAAHPPGRRPVRGRPAGRPRHGRGPLPGARRPGRRTAGRATRWRPRRRCCGQRCEARAGPAGDGRHRRGAAPARRRARGDRVARLPVVLPHRRRRGRPDPRAWGCGSRPAARAPAAWSTTCWASPGSTRSATAC